MANLLDLALIQIRPEKGPIEKNAALLQAAFAQMAEQPPQLIVLPEAALSGYFLEGATFECARSAQEVADLLANAWQAVSAAAVEVVCGFFENDRGTLYNSALAVRVASDTVQILHVHRKIFLPTYGVFDEARFVTRGRQLRTYTGMGGTTAIAICEDLWHGLVPVIVALQGAQVLIVPSASPGRGMSSSQIGSVERWHALLRLVASEHGIYVLYSGLVGFEGGKAMSGASCIIDPFGNIVGTAPIFEPAILRAQLDLDDIGVARASLPLLGDLNEVLSDLMGDLHAIRDQAVL